MGGGLCVLCEDFLRELCQRCVARVCAGVRVLACSRVCAGVCVCVQGCVCWLARVCVSCPLKLIPWSSWWVMMYSHAATVHLPM